MRVSDEMVREAAIAYAKTYRGEDDPLLFVDDIAAMRAALEAALSHAAGQEAEQRPTNAPETGEWYWLEDGDLFHSQVSMNGPHLGRYYRDDGRGWEDVRKAEKLAPAPPTTSAEVGRDAARYQFLRDSALRIEWNGYYTFSPGYTPHDADAMDEAIDAALAASSGRKGAVASNEGEG